MRREGQSADIKDRDEPQRAPRGARGFTRAGRLRRPGLRPLRRVRRQRRQRDPPRVVGAGFSVLFALFLFVSRLWLPKGEREQGAEHSCVREEH